MPLGDLLRRLRPSRHRTNEPVTVEIEVLPPLSDCITHCEVHCVRECCGIDAISEDPNLIGEWVARAGLESACLALDQIEALRAVVKDPANLVVSDFLNHKTVNKAARRSLLDFLDAFGLALKEIIGRSRTSAPAD